jgi:acetyl-CoA carboxylase/biotin carboxylase 1
VEESTANKYFIVAHTAQAQGTVPWTERVALRLTEHLTEYVGARAARLLTLRLDEIEVRVRLMPMAVTAAGGVHSMCATPLRLVASSMGGQWLQVEAFQENLDPVTGEPTLLCKPGSSMSHDGIVSCPESIQASNTQATWDRIEGKRALARNQHTIYCYDLPALMEKELVREACSGGALQQVWRKHLLTADELLMTPQGDSQVGTLKRMEGAQRSLGTNDVGMVGWHVQLVTPQYPQGRDLVLVANDCTFKRGSFGTREDHFFAAAAEYAVERQLPFIFCACNAGARLGLADELKNLIRVEWNNPDQPSLGFRWEPELSLTFHRTELSLHAIFLNLHQAGSGLHFERSPRRYRRVISSFSVECCACAQAPVLDTRGLHCATCRMCASA